MTERENLLSSAMIPNQFADSIRPKADMVDPKKQTFIKHSILPRYGA